MEQTQDISIRYIKEEDYNDLIELIKIPVKAVLPKEEFELDKINALIKLALSNEEFTGIVLVIKGRVKGFILGYITEHYFHSKKIAYCMAIFVDETCRKYGYEMVKAFEAWGKYRQAQTLSISTFTNLSPKSLGKLYKRLGYSEKEVVHWKDV